MAMEMDGRRLAGILGTLALIVIGFFLRMGDRDEDSADIREEAMKIVAMMDDYEYYKNEVDPIAERAHQKAFGSSYQMAGRRRRAKFDQDKYLEEFFSHMIEECDMRNKREIKKRLLRLQGLDDGEPAVASDDGGALGEAVGVAADGLDGGASSGAEADPAAESADGEAGAATGRLTRAEFDALSDEEIESVLFERIVASLPKEPGAQQKAVKALSKGERMLFITRAVEAEVANGGFDQWFANSTGVYTKLAIPAFALIDAKKHATLMRRAIAVYARNNPDQTVFKVDKHVKGYLKKYKDKSFRPIEKTFYTLDLTEPRVKYIRANAGQFCDE